jgi:hypothetical protein
MTHNNIFISVESLQLGMTSGELNSEEMAGKS